MILMDIILMDFRTPYNLLGVPQKQWCKTSCLVRLQAWCLLDAPLDQARALAHQPGWVLMTLAWAC